MKISIFESQTLLPEQVIPVSTLNIPKHSFILLPSVIASSAVMLVLYRGTTHIRSVWFKWSSYLAACWPTSKSDGPSGVLKDNYFLQPHLFDYLTSFLNTVELLSTVKLEGKTLLYFTIPDVALNVHNIYICSTTYSWQQCDILPLSDVTWVRVSWGWWLGVWKCEKKLGVWS